MVLWSFLLIPAADTGWVYPVGAVLSGGYFLYEAHQLNGRAQREERELKPMRLFHGSITYLTVIFLAVAIDPLLRF